MCWRGYWFWGRITSLSIYTLPSTYLRLFFCHFVGRQCVIYVHGNYRCTKIGVLDPCRNISWMLHSFQCNRKHIKIGCVLKRNNLGVKWILDLEASIWNVPIIDDVTYQQIRVDKQGWDLLEARPRPSFPHIPDQHLFPKSWILISNSRWRFSFCAFSNHSYLNRGRKAKMGQEIEKKQASNRKILE